MDTSKLMPDQEAPLGVLAWTPDPRCAFLLSFLSCLIKGGDAGLELVRGLVQEAKMHLHHSKCI